MVAAEAFCTMLLKQFDPENAIFKRGRQDWWPSLVPAIDELLKPKNLARLTDAEIRLLDLLKGLNDSPVGDSGQPKYGHCRKRQIQIFWHHAMHNAISGDGIRLHSSERVQQNV